MARPPRLVQTGVHRDVRVALLLHHTARAARVPQRGAHSEPPGGLPEALEYGPESCAVLRVDPDATELQARPDGHSHADRCGDRVHSVRDAHRSAQHREPNHQCVRLESHMGRVLDRPLCPDGRRRVHNPYASQFVR